MSKKHKFDEKKVMELARQGVKATDIAKTQGVHYSTIYRFLDKKTEEFASLETFKEHHPDIMAALQQKSAEVRFRIFAELEDRDFAGMTFHELRSLLHTLSVTQGVDFDKHRLLTGKSTENLSSLLLLARADAAKFPLDE